MKKIISPFTILAISAFFLLVSCHSTDQIQDSKGEQFVLSIGDSTNQIYSLVQKGNTEQALKVFEKINSEMALQLKASYDDAEKNFSMGLIGFEDFFMVQSRINYAILETLPTQETPTLIGADTREKIRILVTDNALEEALLLMLPNLKEDATLQLGRLRAVKNYLEKGLITKEQMLRVQNQVQFAILELVK